MYKNLILYYFSGTGNALTANRWIAENAEKKKINVKLVSIDRFDKIEAPPGGENTLIGFSFPTHGFNIPWFMLKFILKFPRVKKCGCFILNTRAGSVIGRVHLPGINGIAVLVPALLLLLKGFSLKGVLPLDMPSNWISVHPGFGPVKAGIMLTNCRAAVDLFTSKIFSMKRYFHYKAYIFLPIDLALSPISFMYFVYFRFFLAKTYMASKGCNTCRLCEQKCPTGSIKIIDDRPYWSLTCESCMRCMNICPVRSIESSYLLAGMIIFVSSLVPLPFILGLTHEYISDFLLGPLDFAMSWVITISVYCIVYAVVFLILRFSWINNLFTYTSLTRYWSRYMAPGISSKDFGK